MRLCAPQIKRALKVISMHGCEHCKEVNQTFRIRKPQDLRKAINVARDNVSDGTIVESNYWPEGVANFNGVPFEELVSGAQWNDFVDIYFECPQCKSLYNLSAETYHGSGGSWSPAKRKKLLIRRSTGLHNLARFLQRHAKSLAKLFRR